MVSKTFGLVDFENGLATDMVSSGEMRRGCYSLHEIDADTLEALIDIAKEDEDEQWDGFLCDVQLNDASIYYFDKDTGHGFVRLGCVAVFN